MAEITKKRYLCDNQDLMSEFDIERNVGMDISQLTSGSHKQLWWKCKLGHSWPAAVSKRFLGQKCPFCSGKKAWKGYNDLSTTNPELVHEWDFRKNETPIHEYRPMSNKKVWWICDKGHSWDAVIAKRVNGEKCPVCQGKQILVGFNDLATTLSDLVMEWDYEKNAGIVPSEFSKGSDHKVWWICKQNHSWKAAISSRSSGVGCPQCAKELQSSFPEKVVYYYIKKVFPDAITGYKSEIIKPYELDIFIPSLHIGIEYDGERWHQNIDNDLAKNKKCSEEKITLIRIREPRCPVLCDNISHNITIPNPKGDLGNVITQVFTLISNNTGLHYSVDIDLIRDSTEILALLDFSEKGNNLALYYPGIAKEWDYSKNGRLTPHNITANSDKKVWWLCPVGHSYLSSVAERSRGRGCSVCAGKTVLKGFNDFESRFPELSKAWDYHKNKITPDMVSYGSDKKFWWICDKGHSYQCSINNRRAGQGCYYCSGKRVLAGFNDISTTHPEIAQQWCFDLNELDTTEVSAGSGKKVWWECNNCKHRWEASVSNRCLHKTGCPVCSGTGPRPSNIDFETWCKTNQKEYLLAEWDTKANDKNPCEVSKMSSYPAKWICTKCGSTYTATIHNRANGRGCPVCSGKQVRSGINDFESWCLNNGKEYILAEWDPNNILLPSQVSHGSGKQILWICSRCGHHWTAALYSRKSNKGCPQCARTRRSKSLKPERTP